MGDSDAVRTLVLWCPDWPVVVATAQGHLSPHMPIAVISGGKVFACSPQAREEGVRRSLRQREAQARCPGLTVIRHDPGQDARLFEPVVAAVETMAPGVAVQRPGVCAIAVRGPARHFGGEHQAAELLVDHVADSCGVECQVGVADGLFAAGQAARVGAVVEAGRSAEFLAPLDVSVLDRPELVDILRRLGLRTLGDFAALRRRDVTTRFGADATTAHRLASGLDVSPLAVRVPPPELVVSGDLDPPAERVEAAAFAAHALAESLHQRLADNGLACSQLLIEACTENGEELARQWRHDGVLSASDIADRVRWQLDGWLSRSTAGGHEGPTAGVTRVRLIPEGVVAQGGLQLGLWGDAGKARERAHRALSRVQGLLGPDAVLTATPSGGRAPTDHTRWTPWGEERAAARPADQPWPGRLPAPAPAVVFGEPVPALVYGPDASPVGVSGRHQLTAPLCRVAVASTAQAGDGSPARRALEGSFEAAVEVVAWAGPWPVDERW
ncbi:MAG: DNA polymerase Y family protein, partial [Micromonosporaceae bacterium]